MLFLIILFSLSIKVIGDSYYQTVESCLFNSLQMISLSLLKCALSCDQTDCKAFRFDNVSSRCTLYKFDQVCQSNTKCSNFTIFINNRYNGMFHSDITNPAYQILKNANYQNNATKQRYVIEIIDKNRSKPLLKDEDDYVVMALGTYGNSKLIVIPHGNGLIIRNNFATFLTSGLCTSYDNCNSVIRTYKNFNGIKNQVFSIFSEENSFDFDDLKKYILVNIWHFFIAGNPSQFSVSKPIQNLLNLYGLCYANKQSNLWDGFYRGNVCENVTNYKSETCRKVV